MNDPHPSPSIVADLEVGSAAIVVGQIVIARTAAGTPPLASPSNETSKSLTGRLFGSMSHQFFAVFFGKSTENHVD